MKFHSISRQIFTALAILLAVGMTAKIAIASVVPGTYTPTIIDANAPTGTHLQTGTISCTVDATLAVSCTPYELAGVGHTNADLSLIANYTATVDCFNPGTNPNNPIESHTTSATASSTTTITSEKNGRLAVPAKSVSSSVVPLGCPNPNWTPVIRPGTLTLTSFTYTLTFEGFTGAYITISATDP